MSVSGKMTKKKKQPKNAYYFFMRDFKEEQEQKGVEFLDGMKEVAEVASSFWKDLSPAEKARYEAKAAEHKQREKGNLENKFTTTGKSYAEVHREEHERQQQDMRMVGEIQGTVRGLDRQTTLKTRMFHFIHFNYYCRLENGKFIVCEVALAEFNLEDGVRNVYHTLIRHETLPLGYSFDASKTSEETHRIPVPPLAEGIPYDCELFLKLKSILERGKKGSPFPPIYTLPNHIEVAQHTLTNMAEKYWQQDPDIFRVYPITLLFFELRNACSPPGPAPFPVMHLAERELDKDLYNFAPCISCKLHEGTDACIYCSRSIVHRWGFLICDHCCKDIDVVLIPGQHIPINAAVKENTASGFDAPADWSRPTSRASAKPRPPKPSTPEKYSDELPIRVLDYSKLPPPEESARIIKVSAGGSIVPAVAPGGSCWGVTPDGSIHSPLRLPKGPSNASLNTPPIKIKDETEFPELGVGRGQRNPVAVAGRGRGRLLAGEAASFPGNRVPAAVAGRGKGPKLAANFNQPFAK